MNCCSFISVWILSVVFVSTNATDDVDDNFKERDERIFTNKLVGFYSITTVLSLQTRTISAAFTCLSTATPAACTGRRRRSFARKLKNLDNDEPTEDQDK